MINFQGKPIALNKVTPEVTDELRGGNQPTAS